jgi:hypothetical protein
MSVPITHYMFWCMMEGSAKPTAFVGDVLRQIVLTVRNMLTFILVRLKNYVLVFGEIKT